MTDDYQKNTSSTTKTKLWLDVLIFIAFLIAMEPHSSGLAIHEWLTLALLGTMTIHLLLSWNWIIETTRRFFGKLGLQNRLNYILNWLLFLDGTLLMVSGIMISEVALPSLNIHLPPGFGWRRLHDLSADFVLILLGLHTALHWSWIVNTVKRYVSDPLLRLVSPKLEKGDS